MYVLYVFFLLCYKICLYGENEEFFGQACWNLVLLIMGSLRKTDARCTSYIFCLLRSDDAMIADQRALIGRFLQLGRLIVLCGFTN